MSARPAFDPRLCLVTDPALTASAGLERVVGQAVAGGVTLVQLRDPYAKGAVLLEAARRLKALLAGTSVRLIVNDRLDIALAADADGAHVGQDDLPPAEARALLGEHRLLGLSVTHQDQIAAIDPRGIDYVGLGPVFATMSKPDAAPPLGLDGLAAAAARLDLPAVAIGGIDAGNAPAVMRAGAAGIAVISAICGAADPGAAARTLRRTIDAAISGG
ncbi:thiamine phosphate synthase [Marinimicrococcus flavescens]|uniref:Thiamine-phosphate synthase n=1 Tax=Marinimicrococcus flavescens TaxID=3031815 RepID=A0AAP3XQL3_9PROT|nr:thiamine phosphate synthase [Marinimicrococcus flavescens]